LINIIKIISLTSSDNIKQINDRLNMFNKVVLFCNTKIMKSANITIELFASTVPTYSTPN